jgi:DNA-directed RNA polymerase specialized sigma24 family protein
MLMVDSTRHNPGADSRTEDEALVQALRVANFQGSVWDRFAQEIARYALPIIKSWILSMQIFTKCAEKNVPCPGPVHNIRDLQEDDASWMADEIVARALNKFRDKVLRPGGWSPEGGSSLNTMFITQCLFQFPNVYRHWLVENKQTLVHELEELEFVPAGPEGDPLGLVMVREEIDHALQHYVKDEFIAKVLILRALQYTMKEIAEMLDVTEKALDGLLQRRWRKLKEHLQDGEQGEPKS